MRAGWTCEDAEAARLQANQTARPRGHRGPTPEESWRQRRPIGPRERAAFAAAVRRALPGGRAGLAARRLAAERAGTGDLRPLGVSGEAGHRAAAVRPHEPPLRGGQGERRDF